ncbi:HAMP domain-containing protein [Dictyobacter vulcani]|nr:HAMP domain-containing protein [Dictyobacter vulcani]
MNHTTKPATSSSPGPSQSGTPMLPNTQPFRGNDQLRIRSSFRRGGSLLIDLPIGTRLTLGFLTAALLASLVVGAIGLQRSQSLSRQSEFYRSILTTNTNLNTGTQYLQLIKTESQAIVDQLQAPQPSIETLKSDKLALKNLIQRYDTLLTGYLNKDVLAKHPEQQSILAITGQDATITHQQDVLAGSAQRTWLTHKTALVEIMRYFDNNDVAKARYLQQVQVELTNSDASSATRALIQFNGRLTDSIQQAETIESQNQIITTVIGSVIAFILIVIIGLVISGTIIRRLKQLREVTQAVEQGQLNRRVNVIGRDEIADVSGSVNAMLEAIVGLLDETRNQRDALTNAAEHLFSDMRVVSAGDLRINAPVSNDPIGMLANAFNFTVGRFRRFLQRTKTTAEQMDVVARQQIERSESFTQALLQLKSGSKTTWSQPGKELEVAGNSMAGMKTDNQQIALLNQLRQTRERIQQIANEEIMQRFQNTLMLAEQTTSTIEHLTNLPQTASTLNMRPNDLRTHFQDDLHTLHALNQRMTQEIQRSQEMSTRGFQEIEQEMTRLTNKTRQLKAQNADIPTPRANQDMLQEIIKQSTHFANDVHAMGRQVNHIAQEVRTSIVNFQLDTVDSGANLPALSQPGSAQSGSSPNRPALPKRQNSTGLLEMRH